METIIKIDCLDRNSIPFCIREENPCLSAMSDTEYYNNNIKMNWDREKKKANGYIRRMRINYSV